jgi:hypothetical protein
MGEFDKERPDGRATPLDYALGNISPELKQFIANKEALIRLLESQVKELESRQILHLSLRLAGITGRTSWGGNGPKPLQDHLGIAVYFIWGPPADLARQASLSKEYGMAFGLSPEEYQELMSGHQVLIHEVKPENGRLKPGGQFPIEFLTEGEKDGDLTSGEAPVNGSGSVVGDGGDRGHEGGEPGAPVQG